MLLHMLFVLFFLYVHVQIFCLKFWKALSRLCFDKTKYRFVRSFLLSEEAVLITMQGCGELLHAH